MGFWNKWFGSSKDQDSCDSEAFSRYQRQLEQEHPGKVALMHGNDLVGVFAEDAAAFAEGRKRFGDNHFRVWGIPDPSNTIDTADLPYWIKSEAGLAEELATFEQHRQDLEQNYPGQFALLRGERLVGVFPELLMAEEVGDRLFGLEQRLVKQIATPNIEELDSPRNTARGHVA